MNPSEVHRSGVEVGNIATSVKSALSSSDTEIAAAHSGWMGKSADTLASMAAEWQRTTQVLVDFLVEHGNKFTAAAKKYGQVDESEADSVRSAAENL